MPIQTSSAIRSEALRDFISHRPSLLIRRGIPLFFLILAALVTSTFFIQYPDIVKASAKVTSINPPKQLIFKTGGRLVQLFKKDNDNIASNEIIGFIESNANHTDVIQLAAILDTLQYFADSNKLEEIPRFWKNTNQSVTHLGELQQAHQTFIQSYIAFKEYLNAGFYIAKKQMINKDLTNTKKLLDILYQQKDLQQQDLAISTENYNVHDTLHNETLINEIEFRSQKSQYINKKMTIPQINASIIGNESQQNSLRKEMMEMDNQVLQQKATFVQALNSYKSQVEEWKQKYLLIAPVAGKLSLVGFLEVNQQLQAGQVIGYITNESNRYYVELLVPRSNAGKVNSGQQVQLKFASYPAQEYGSVRGKIDYIKTVPTDSGYLAKVSLPNGLKTNYKKTIVFQEGLLVQAEIITAEKKLSDRFFNGLKELID